MTPAAEPLSLRLPKDILVLQPMQGHLELEPVLLRPGLRLSLGSRESCAVRLPSSSVVQPEHCVIEVIGHRTLLSEWTPEATWLNDVLVTEPQELLSGDRLAIGPFDFRVRPASPDELLYAKLMEGDGDESTNVDEVLRLKRAFDQARGDDTTNTSSVKHETALIAVSGVRQETAQVESPSDLLATDRLGSERLSQHVSKLLSDLQNQIVALQEREAELHEQLRQHREEAQRTSRQSELSAEDELVSGRTKSLPKSAIVRAADTARQLQIEREAFEQERAAFAAEQAAFREQCQQVVNQHQALQGAIREFDADQKALQREQEALQQRRTELASREREVAERERQLSARQADVPEEDSGETRAAATTLVSRSEQDWPDDSVERLSPPPRERGPREVEPTVRPLQMFLTLVAFAMSAALLGMNTNQSEVATIVGWSAALMGAISTLDLLLRRVLASLR